MCTAESGFKLICKLESMHTTPHLVLSFMADEAKWMFTDTFHQYAAMLAVFQVTEQVSAVARASNDTLLRPAVVADQAVHRTFGHPTHRQSPAMSQTFFEAWLVAQPGSQAHPVNAIEPHIALVSVLALVIRISDACYRSASLGT
jgi:hypothetical protein